MKTYSLKCNIVTKNGFIVEELKHNFPHNTWKKNIIMKILNEKTVINAKISIKLKPLRHIIDRMVKSLYQHE